MIEWAVTSSVLIFVVLVLRRILMGNISLRLQYGLWALVLLRLLLPVSLGATAVSVLNAVENAHVSDPVVGYVGGVTPDNIRTFFQNGFVGVGIGSNLFPKEYAAQRRWDLAAQAVAKLVEAASGV